MKPNNPLILPKLPEHLKLRFLPAWEFQRNFSKYKKNVQRFSDKWNNGSLKKKKELLKFLDSLNGLIVIARQNGAMASEALNFLMDVMDVHIKRSVKNFLRKRSNLNREEREHKRENKNLYKGDGAGFNRRRQDPLITDPEWWEFRAWRITRSYIISDQMEKYSRKREIGKYIDDDTASEEKHLSLIDRDLRQRFLFLMGSTDFFDDGEMEQIVKSLACRGKRNVFRFFNPESLYECGLSGGLGYDPFYLEPDQVALLDNYKNIENYFNCFNDGDFPDYDEYSLKTHIEKEIGTLIEKVFASIKAIPETHCNFFSYLFGLDENGFSKLTSKLDQLNELLNDQAPPICEDPTKYDILAEGRVIQDEKNGMVGSRKTQVRPETEFEKTYDMKEIFNEIKKRLTPRRAEILDMMLTHEQIGLVAEKMNVSPSYISKEFSIIQKTISIDPHLRDLVSDLL